MIKNWIRRFKWAREPKALVLMYHRVADLAMDPWDLAVSSHHFKEHLELLTQRFRVYTIMELIQQYMTNSIVPGSVAITFDDGYEDNFSTARPLLEQYNCSATFYISSQYIDRQELFWWDELQQIIFDAVQLQDKLCIWIGNEEFNFQLGEGAKMSVGNRIREQSWKWPEPPPTVRCALYLALWEKLRASRYSDIIPVMNELKRWASLTEVEDRTCIPMKEEQVNALAGHPLFDIGMHTHTHLALNYHEIAVQYEEFLSNKRYLEEVCGVSPQSVTYPYGLYNEDSIEVAQSLGLSAGFTTQAQAVCHQSQKYQLGRFQVRNCDGNILEERLMEWLER